MGYISRQGRLLSTERLANAHEHKLGTGLHTASIKIHQYYYHQSDSVRELISPPANLNIHLLSPPTPSSLSFQHSQRPKSKPTMHQKPSKSACTTVSVRKFYLRFHYSKRAVWMIVVNNLPLLEFLLHCRENE